MNRAKLDVAIRSAGEQAAAMVGDPDVEEFDELELGGYRPRWYVQLAIHTQHHRRAIRVGWWVTAAVVVLVLVLTSGWGRPGSTRRSADPDAATSAADQARTAVVMIADPTVPLRDYIRTTSAAGACPLVRVGRSAPSAITARLRARLPRFTVVDLGRTLDQFTGLCAVQLRADGPAGTVLALRIAAPASGTGAPNATYSPDTVVGTASRTRWAAVVTTSGWSVLIGATGPSAALPETADLLRLAQEPALLWGNR